MIEIRKGTLTNGNTAKQLIDLSQVWVEENSTYGLIKNTREDLKEPLFIAVDGDKIIGYTFGHFYTTERKTSYIGIGVKCFDIDEIFVLEQYRNQGIGEKLFREIESCVKDECVYITLATATKDYEKILRFYTKMVGMTFHNAFLIKSCKDIK
jgi:GNAT superfamily N-acetyltransferase